MATTPDISLAEQVKKVPAASRPIVQAALKAVRGAVPKGAEEIPYRSSAPRSKSAMWKLVRYRVDGHDVVGVGTFTSHAAIWFYRGRELDDGRGLLHGSGKDSRSLTLRTAADAEKPIVRSLVRKAFKLPR